jgi:predicted ATP-dependent endonuclease of OLD family
MSINSIKIKNLLSFDLLYLADIEEINCIVGRNNTGKSNLLKLIRYFYQKLEGQKVLNPDLNSNYSGIGSIAITYDTSRILKIVAGNNGNSPFFKHIYKTLFSGQGGQFISLVRLSDKKKSTYTLTLTINQDGSTKWSTNSSDALEVISYLYPFFAIETRHIDLYDWDQLWTLISKLKSFNVDSLKSKDIIEFMNKGISETSNTYRDYVGKIQEITNTAGYSYREKVLNYVKVGLEGQTFMINGEQLSLQSDGTNSHRYVELFLTLAISLTRRDYIEPIIYIDEPEVGLHPTLNEKLIRSLYDTYVSYKKTKPEKELGKYATPYPKIIFSTHSPNIVKSTIKLFANNHKLFHFSKKGENLTISKVMNSRYTDTKFLNIFSDNEARLFFSDFILFVEGQTELELFRNFSLSSKFHILKEIDVYASNAVSLGGISPEFSNAAIPYLVLYDAEVLIDIDKNSRTIKFKKSPLINLKSYLVGCKRSYFNSPQRDQHRSINHILKTYEGSSIDLGKLTIDANEVNGEPDFNLENLIHMINQNVLQYQNRMIASTTIEGVLLNARSAKLISKWFISKVMNSFQIDHPQQQSRIIRIFKGKTNFSSPDSVLKAASFLLKPGNYTPDLSHAEQSFVTKLRRHYIRDTLAHIKSNFANENEIITAIRLIFCGKTSSLISLENKAKKDIDPNYLAKIENLKKQLAPLSYLFGKTNGWVTSFLDFSIAEIECSCTPKNFKPEFQNYFPELYAILSRLQPG